MRTNVNTSLMPRTIVLLEGGAAAVSSQTPGSWKTTIWPRCGVAPNHGENLFTSTRSPGMIVFSIDCEGMKKAWKDVAAPLQKQWAEAVTKAGGNADQIYKELQDSIEQPGRWRAQSGRLRAWRSS